MATAIAPSAPPTAADESSRAAEPALDTTVRLVTPERIAFEYPLAGPFHRALAYLIDLVVMLVLAYIFFFLTMILSFGSSSALGLFFAFLFALMYGYGAFWEGIFNGQTPGKRALSLRVVSDQGVPITGAQAVLRNVLWTFDGLAFGYIPAVACMILTGKFQRLGDLAAGTMVMIERRPARGAIIPVNERAVRELADLLPPRIDAGPELSRALGDYVRSRARFGKPRREEMAERLARPVRKRYGLPADSSADAVVCAMYHRVFLGE